MCNLIMAFVLTCRVTIGSVVLNSVHDCRIESSWQNLTDTCQLELPSRGVLKNGSEVTEVSFEDTFKVGQTVTVELGYNGVLNTEFEGYVAEISPKYPFTLRCEDGAYLLKRAGNLTKSYKSVTLKNLLKELMPEVVLGEGFPEVTLDNFLVERATKAKVLQELADKYGLAVYFRGNTLYAGLPFTTESFDARPRYDLLQNVESDGLTFKNASDVQLKARVVSILKNNNRIEIPVGDPNGEERTLFYYNISDTATLKKLAEADLERYKYDGYTGRITGFGEPFVKHTQTVQITDPRYSEPNGFYLVDKVQVQFGANGFRREVEIGKKVADG